MDQHRVQGAQWNKMSYRRAVHRECQSQAGMRRASKDRNMPQSIRAKWNKEGDTEEGNSVCGIGTLAG